MHITIFGGSGYIGNHLVQHFVNTGNTVVVVDRTKPVQSDKRVNYVLLDLTRDTIPNIEQTDVVINLTGYTINTRWNNIVKKMIYDSRIVRIIKMRMGESSFLILASTRCVSFEQKNL